jgi:nicotinamidase-related amidase
MENKTASELKRFSKLLKREKTALLIIDIQERILPVILNHQQVLNNTIKLVKGFRVLDIPVFFTEQYPKGLGPTSSVLKEELNEANAYQKMSFSCSGAEDLFEAFREKSIEQIVVTGIESHVCVQQTVLDLLENKFQVNLCADAVSSRKEIDYKTALDRMRQHGAEITTAESVLFELLSICGTDEFKQVSKIVK